MTRRVFIAFLGYIFTRKLSADQSSPTYWQLLNSTLIHLFPTTQRFAGAKEIDMLNFFKLQFDNKNFDKNDVKFIINGTKELYRLNNNYVNLSKDKKEQLLREFEQTNFGSNFLSTLMYYSFEAMIGDPIYGGNKNNLGWKNIKHNAGFPQPKTMYGKNNV